MLTQELLAEGAHIATQALSAGPAFRSRSAAVARCVRRQHLIVAPTNPGAHPHPQYAHTSTNTCRNPSLPRHMEAPHSRPLHHHPLFPHPQKHEKPLTPHPPPTKNTSKPIISSPPLRGTPRRASHPLPSPLPTTLRAQTPRPAIPHPSLIIAPPLSHSPHPFTPPTPAPSKHFLLTHNPSTPAHVCFTSLSSVHCLKHCCQFCMHVGPLRWQNPTKTYIPPGTCIELLTPPLSRVGQDEHESNSYDVSLFNRFRAKTFEPTQLSFTQCSLVSLPIVIVDIDISLCACDPLRLETLLAAGQSGRLHSHQCTS